MAFTQIWYLHKQGLQDQNNCINNYAEFTLQWRNYPIWRYPVGTVPVLKNLIKLKMKTKK